MNEPLAGQHLVFISHRARDTWVARQISREIAARGAETFLDEANLDVGDEFEDRILEALDRTHELVVLITPWALDLPYIWAELGAAWLRRIPIIGLLHGLGASELQENLREQGVEVWFDDIELERGDKFVDSAEKALRESDVLVIILDEAFGFQPNLFFELGAALAGGKKIVSIVPEGIDPAEVPAPLRKRTLVRKDSPKAAARQVASVVTAN